MIKRYICIFILPLLFMSCSGKAIRHQFTVSEKKTIDELLLGLNNINSRTPETLTAKITINGTFGKKKYNAVGSVSFDSTSHQMNIVLYDFIFKTPITTVIKNNDDLSIHYPVDKKLILARLNSFRIKNITGIDMDIDCMVSLIEGSIPLIKNHSVKQVYTEDNGHRYYLILENSKTFETLSFKKGMPDRILFMDKKGNKKIEVYIDKYHWGRNSIYYKKLHLIDEQAKINLNITFSNITINEAVSIMTETDIAIPQGTKIIRY